MLHLSSKMTFSAKKAQTHENLSSAWQKNIFISLERNIFMNLSFALKIVFSNFFSLRNKFFEASVASHSHNLLSCH